MEYTVKGTAIENYVSENGISAYEFCKRFDIDVKTYDRIVRGEKVKLETLFVLSHKMNLSLNSFLA
ncbi:MAG: hypothetical protein IJQ87_04150 [Clostridia bacterium]|nr:hypothetical protein [Clostridia bacterium]